MSYIFDGHKALTHVSLATWVMSYRAQSPMGSLVDGHLMRREETLVKRLLRRIK